MSIDPLVVIAVVIAVLLLGLLVVGVRTLKELRSQKLRSEIVSFDVEHTFGSALSTLQERVEHYVDINAVLALTEEFDADPDLVQKLEQYSHQTVAAALLYRVNSLGNQLHRLNDELTTARNNLASSPSYTAYKDRVANLEQLVMNVESQLKSADEAIRAFNRPSLVK